MNYVLSSFKFYLKWGGGHNIGHTMPQPSNPAFTKPLSVLDFSFTIPVRAYVSIILRKKVSVTGRTVQYRKAGVGLPGLLIYNLKSVFAFDFLSW